MTSEGGLDAPTLVLLVLGGLLLLPFLTMGLGVGGMMGGYGGMAGSYGGTGGAWSIVGSLVQLAVPVLLLVGGYMLLKRTRQSTDREGDAIAELRRTYARGDLSDEEFERRLERLR